MALTGRSLIRYGFEVTSANSALDFKIVSGGSEVLATLQSGFYSLTGLMDEVVRSMNAADPSNVYTYTIDRSVNGGIDNTVTIATTGAFLSLLFGTGSRSTASCASLLGYTATDKTGATSYTSQNSAGESFVPAMIGYGYQGPLTTRKLQGTVNISASGAKEAVVFNVMQFLDIEYRFETQADTYTTWADFFTWAIKQRPIEITPIYSDYATVYDVTLDSTEYDGKGLGFQMREMLPEFPFYFRTGRLRFRLKATIL
jgi:hypothetical protein